VRGARITGRGRRRQGDGRDAGWRARGGRLSETAASEQWRTILSGDDPGLRWLRATWRRVPGTPRCKVCAAPFQGPARLLARLALHGRSPLNPLMCGMCMRALRRHPGGAEITGSVLFADVRGSTGIAERRPPAEYRRLLQGFYALATAAIERRGGILDKFLGDGVMALYVPLTAGRGHAAQAIDTARDILGDLRRAGGGLADLGVGCGVHTGEMFVGALGTDDRLDFSALGDTVNVAARLGSLAEPGRLLAGLAAWEAAGRGAPEGVVRRQVVSGRDTPLDVVHLELTPDAGSRVPAGAAGPPPAQPTR